MVSIEELWNLVRSCFEVDDGSLPSLEIQNLTSAEIARIYASIRQEAEVVTKNPSYWDNESDSERLLDSVQNAASLVATGQAEPFHFSVAGIRRGGVEVPCIGIFVFQDLLAFDYRMGSHWGPEQVFALFGWLRSVVESTGGASLVPSTSEGPPDPQAFGRAWRTFCHK